MQEFKGITSNQGARKAPKDPGPILRSCVSPLVIQQWQGGHGAMGKGRILPRIGISEKDTNVTWLSGRMSQRKKARHCCWAQTGEHKTCMPASQRFKPAQGALINGNCMPLREVISTSCNRKLEVQPPPVLELAGPTIPCI